LLASAVLLSPCARADEVIELKASQVRCGSDSVISASCLWVR